MAPPTKKAYGGRYMAMFNNTFITGTITKLDSQISTTSKGVACLRMVVSVEHTRRTELNPHPSTSTMQVDIYGSLATHTHTSLNVGDRVTVTGKLSEHSGTGILVIVADEVAASLKYSPADIHRRG